MFCPSCGEATPAAIGRETGEEDAPTPSDPNEAEYRQRLERALGEGYELRELIGQGGFGVVYSVWDVKLEREVAVKALRHDLFPSPELLERFQREAKAVAKLRHPNILPVYTVGEGEGIAFMVMPKVYGESLKDVLNREGRLPTEEARRIFLEAADALAEAHEAGIIHRDIKPENIMLEGKARRVLLMDFGIAKAVTAEGAGLTATGMIVGTPQYMSPEQATAEHDITPQSDIYSLGLVAYQMFAGELPFKGTSIEQLIYQRVATEPKAISDEVQDLPHALSEAVMRCLAKEPHDRWESSAKLTEALAASGAVALSSATARLGSAGLGRRQLAALGVGAVVVAVVVAVFFMRGGTVTQPEEWTFTDQRRLTFSGTADHPAISPDGSLVAYVDSSSSSARILMQDFAGSDPIELFETVGGEIGAIRWISDGMELALTLRRPNESNFGRYWISRLGGPLNEYRGEAWSTHSPTGLVRVSREGERVARLERDWESADSSDHLIVYESGGHASDTLLENYPRRFIAHEWSPNGEWILFSSEEEDWVTWWLEVVSVNGARRHTIDSAGGFDSPTVFDGGVLVRRYEGVPEITHIPFDWEKGDFTGQTVSLATIPGLNSGWDVSYNSRMAYQVITNYFQLWTVRVEDPATGSVRAVRITDRADEWSDAVISPDGSRIAAVRYMGGPERLVVMDADGTDERLVIGESGKIMNLAWSPDGTRLAFNSDVTGEYRLTVADVETGITTKMSDREVQGFSSNRRPHFWTSSGDRIIFQPIAAPDSACVVEVDVASQTERVVRRMSPRNDLGCFPSVISPDDRTMHAWWTSAEDYTNLIDAQTGVMRQAGWELPFLDSVDAEVLDVYGDALSWTTYGLFFKVVARDVSDQSLGQSQSFAIWVLRPGRTTAKYVADMPVLDDGQSCEPSSISADGLSIMCFPVLTESRRDIWVATLRRVSER